MKRTLALLVSAAFFPTLASAGTGGTVTVAIPGAFPAGKSVVVRFAAAIDSPVAAGVNSVTTQGTVSGTGFASFLTGDPDMAGPGEPNDATVTLVNAAPDMALSKTDGGAMNVLPLATVSYTLNYSNIGNQGATGVTLMETVPSDTIFNAAASTGTWSCPNGSGVGTLCNQVVGGVNGGGSGGSAVFALTFTPSCPPSTLPLLNSATVVDDGNNGPDPNVLNNQSSDTTSVNAGGTTTTVGSNRNPADVGDSVTLTATVTSVIPGCVPNGQATIKDGGTDLPGLPTFLVSGQVAHTSTTLTPGTHPITGEYLGNPPFNPSTSSVLNQVVVDATPVLVGDVKISEFRFQGDSGTTDEYVELVNATGSPITVKADGWALSKWNAGLPATIGVVPGATVIPPKGHFLFVNTLGFSLGGYPAESGATVGVGDVQYTGGSSIPTNDGIALFKSTTTLDLANRLDAAGFTSVSDVLYKEGAGLPIVSPPASGPYTFVRQSPGGVIKDTDDNVADFQFLSTDAGLYNSVQSTLGAPGPEKLTSPIDRSSGFSAVVIEPLAGVNSNPNRVRTGVGNSGTLQFRRRVTNNTGASVTKLRLRVLSLTTLHSAGYATPTQADLRPVSGGDVVIPATSNGVTTLQGLTLETPPLQAIGGGINSSLAQTDVSLATPLLNGTTTDINIVLNIHRVGSYNYFISIEALP